MYLEAAAVRRRNGVLRVFVLALALPLKWEVGKAWTQERLVLMRTTLSLGKNPSFSVDVWYK